MPKLTEGSFLVLQEASVEFMPSFEVAVDQGLIEAGIFSPPQAANNKTRTREVK